MLFKIAVVVGVLIKPLQPISFLSICFHSQKELVFMPSVGVEFVTQMGVNVPEFVVSTVEMHTSMYHESALNAKITMEQGQIKLSIPAPQGTTKFLRIR